MLKDELGRQKVKEFVALQPKTYTFLKDFGCVSKKTNGKNSVSSEGKPNLEATKTEHNDLFQ